MAAYDWTRISRLLLFSSELMMIFQYNPILKSMCCVFILFCFAFCLWTQVKYVTSNRCLPFPHTHIHKSRCRCGKCKYLEWFSYVAMDHNVNLLECLHAVCGKLTNQRNSYFICNRIWIASIRCSRSIVSFSTH